MARKNIVAPITDEMRDAAEKQIKEQQTETKYDLRDFTVDYIVQEFQSGLFFIPDYQRKFIWPEKNKIGFIESLFLGLPIPMLFVADLDDGRLEIVDGAQRIQTLEAFRNDDLKLKDLKYLTSLENFKYSDLPKSYQRKFNTRALRMVILEDSTTLERRQEIFNRINTSAIKAKPSEIRRGDFDSKFMQFITKCSKDPLFVSLCPVSKQLEDRREREELVLRFFAYSSEYKKFKHDVGKFLDKFLKDNEDTFDENKLAKDFKNMLTFVDRYFSSGFAKKKGYKSTPRVRFESISVGVHLALMQNPNLVPHSMNWLDSKEFKTHTTTHASNSGPKLRGRVEYVRDVLLK
ncbi:DUF262 domain-containing protein [Aquimarina sp. BL5]|uniref:DUF262 domain-containing protein n=1 Tax=Aquimarina sp. BL5 TaxID=1714860 RepID=UPI000E54608B|nr:DUF262 domain-containing protein [Aquimarina sp. BL5]AXT50315.1 DUF262 domain-containing protein [Aquimarina sp. BL5]RKM90140.1 DUF262 domain-containing protein [Aquimarina sp. BL5]